MFLQGTSRNLLWLKICGHYKACSEIASFSPPLLLFFCLDDVSLSLVICTPSAHWATSQLQAVRRDTSSL